MEQTSVANTRTAPARTATRTYEAAAWRSPSPHRFDNRPANDFGQRVEAAPVTIDAEEDTGVPRWIIVVGGAIIVAMMAVFAANAMAL